jgi:FkbM family methyltransferase
MIGKLFNLWSRFFGRPRYRRLNSLLLHLGLRGLGILNYYGKDILPEELRILKLILSTTEREVVVFDVGAHEGDYARAVAKINPTAQVFCFEPHPDTFAVLKNNVDNDRIKSFQIALGDKSAEMMLFDYDENDGSQHASLYRDVIEAIHKSKATAHSVTQFRLDDFADRLGLERIDLLKIDTEGHEFAVLQGASRFIEEGRIKYIQFEFNEMNLVSRVFLGDFRLLLSGYSLFRLLPHGLLPLRGTALEEIFAYQNIIAIQKGKNEI